MIHMQDIRRQYYRDENVSIDPTTMKVVFMAFAIIYTLIALFLIGLDWDTFFLMLKSGNYLTVAIYLLCGLIKYLTIAWWWLIIFRCVAKIALKTYSLIACGVGMLEVLISMIIYIFLIYQETHSMVDVFLHPFVIEYTAFIMVDGAALYYSLSLPETMNFSSNMTYYPVFQQQAKAEAYPEYQSFQMNAAEPKFYPVYLNSP